MIYLFCGTTKGKTSSALGTITRALGYNKKVRVVFFMKHWKTSEISFYEKLPKDLFDIDFFQSGDNDFIYVNKETNHTTLNKAQKTLKFGKIQEKDQKDFDKAQKGYQKALMYLKEQPFLLVLDEIIMANEFGLITTEQILEIISLANKDNVHIVLTGRNPTKEVINSCDLVSEIHKVKHPFDKNVYAVKGLDY